MSKTLKHHKRKQRRRANKTQRLTGGRDFVFNGNQNNLAELDALLNQPNHHVLAKHYSDSCIHCKNLEPEWQNVMSSLKPNSAFTIANLDRDATDYMNEHHYSKHNYGVNGIPTIVYIHKIKIAKPKEYQGELTSKEIMDWFVKVMTDKRLKMTIESDMQASEPTNSDPNAFSTPSAADLDLDQAPADPVLLASEPASEPASALTETNPFDQAPAAAPEATAAPVTDDPPVVQDTTAAAATAAAAAFPEAPLPQASTLSNATDAIKTTAAAIDNNIEQGVNTIKSALTSDINIGNLFSTAPSNNQDLTPAPVNVPAVPSLVGGIKSRRHTRRKNRRSKSSRKSKKSKK